MTNFPIYLYRMNATHTHTYKRIEKCIMYQHCWNPFFSQCLIWVCECMVRDNVYIICARYAKNLLCRSAMFFIFFFPIVATFFFCLSHFLFKYSKCFSLPFFFLCIYKYRTEENFIKKTLMTFQLLSFYNIL